MAFRIEAGETPLYSGPFGQPIGSVVPALPPRRWLPSNQQPVNPIYPFPAKSLAKSTKIWSNPLVPCKIRTTGKGPGPLGQAITALMVFPDGAYNWIHCSSDPESPLIVGGGAGVGAGMGAVAAGVGAAVVAFAAATGVGAGVVAVAAGVGPGVVAVATSVGGGTGSAVRAGVALGLRVAVGLGARVGVDIGTGAKALSRNNLFFTTCSAILNG